MSAEATRRRGVFGRRRDEVQAQTSEVEVRLEAAEGRAQSAEARVNDLQSELMFYGDSIRSLKSDLETMTERVVSRVAPQMVELEARGAEMEALREALAATRAQVETEREQLLAWRNEADEHLVELQAEIRRARDAIDETPERIRLALTPAADAMAKVDVRMAVLAGASLPAQEIEESLIPGWSGGDESPMVGPDEPSRKEAPLQAPLESSVSESFGTALGEEREGLTKDDSLRSLAWD